MVANIQVVYVKLKHEEIVNYEEIVSTVSSLSWIVLLAKKAM